MTGLEVCVDLDEIAENAAALVEFTARVGVTVTGVTKAMLGSPGVARALVGSGVVAIGDSRIENIERLRADGIGDTLVLLRSPMPSQAARVVRSADVSCNTEPSVLAVLSSAAGAAGMEHGVLLMVELGDLREGILAAELPGVVEATLALPNLSLRGLGANLACRSGVVPDDRNMHELSRQVEQIERSFGITLDTVSGGNSANLSWLGATADVGRVNNLRLGESILLGREPLHRTALPGLHTDAVVVRAEVIESKRKPTRAWGTIAEAAFGSPNSPTTSGDSGDIWQTIVAVGHQDTDPFGLEPVSGSVVLGASSDHLVLQTQHRMTAGQSVAFTPTYGALVRAMTSPYATVTESPRKARAESIRKTSDEGRTTR